MNRQKHIQDELNELGSSLPAGDPGTSYSVPEGYFEGFAASVLAKIKGGSPVSAAAEIQELSPLLAGLSRSMPYSVPDGYFQSNIDALPAFTKDEESLVLSFVEKEMPYEVPLGYFANLPEQILEKVQNQQPKVVPIYKRKWMHMAAAAMVAGIMLFSGLTYFKSGGAKTGDPVAVELKKASTQELNDFVKATDISVTDEHVTAQNSTDVKQLLKDVSDKELEAFLEQVPTEDDGELDLN